MIASFGVLDDVGEPTDEIVRSFPVGHVTCETARVKELVPPSQNIGTDLNVTDRTVLRAEARFVIAQGFSARQPAQNVLDDCLIDVKVGDVVADVLVPRIPQEIQFGLVGPEDSSVGAHPMQAFSGVVETLLQFLIDPVRERICQRG